MYIMEIYQSFRTGKSIKLGFYSMRRLYELGLCGMVYIV